MIRNRPSLRPLRLPAGGARRSILWALCLLAPLAGEDLLTSLLPQRFLEAGQGIQKAALSSEGQCLVLLDGGGQLRVVDLHQKRTVRQLAAPAGATVLAVSGDGGLVAAAVGPRVLLSAGGGSFEGKYAAPATVYRMALQPGGRLLALATADGFRLVNLDSGDVEFSAIGTPGGALAFDPEGRTLAVVQGQAITLYELPNALPRWKVAVPFYPSALAVDPKAGVAIGGDGNTLWLCAPKDGAVVQKIPLPGSGKPAQVQFTPDGKGLVLGIDRRLLLIEDLSKGAASRKEVKLEERILALGLSGPAQALFAATESTRHLSLWPARLAGSERAAAVPARPPGLVVVPPQVVIQAPKDLAVLKSDTVELTARVKAAPDQPVAAVRILVDGAPPEAGGRTMPPPQITKVKAGEDLYTFQVPLPNRDCVITLQAEATYANSPLATLRLKRDLPPLLRPASGLRRLRDLPRPGDS